MSLTTHRLIRESLSLAAIVAVWSLASLLAGIDADLRRAVFLAGGIMVALYALVRGLALADVATPAYADETPEGVLRENARALLAAGPWFVGALILSLLRALFQVLLDPVPIELVGDAIGFVVSLLAWTGTATVLLFAVATGAAALRDERLAVATDAAGSADDVSGTATED